MRRQLWAAKPSTAQMARGRGCRFLQPGEEGVDGELVGVRRVRVEPVRELVLADVEPRAEDEPQVVERGEPASSSPASSRSRPAVSSSPRRFSGEAIPARSP